MTAGLPLSIPVFFVWGKGNPANGLGLPFYLEPTVWIAGRTRSLGGYQVIMKRCPSVSSESVSTIIADGSLRTVFQPVVRCSGNSRNTYGYEALSRPYLRDTLIPPESWFRAAYYYQQSTDADWLALTSALGNYTLDNYSDVLFVNVMPSSLLQPEFRDRVKNLVHDRCPASFLTLEIIEYVDYDVGSLRDAINDLRSVGIRIALDDVGRGHSNLESLVELEPDFIKIDRTITSGISTSASKQRLLSAIVQYAGLQSTVIAEGVERVEDLIALEQSGIDLTQGYLWGQPIPASTLTTEWHRLNSSFIL